MSKGQNTRSVILGAFIIAAIAIFALGLFVLGGKQRAFGKTISVNANFENVAGLKGGSNVLFGGVKVGMVESIALLPGNKVRVVMQIESDKQGFIAKNAMVRLGNDGLVGSKIVEIFGGDNKQGNISDGTVLQSEQGSSMEELFTTLQANNKNLLTITQNLKDISEKIVQGEGTIGKLINDPSIVNNLQGLVNKLHISANNAQTLTKEVAVFTSQLDKPGTMTHDLMSDTVIFKRLRSATQKLDDLANNAQGIVRQLNSSANNLNDTEKPAGMMLNDEKTAADLKEVIMNLQTGTIKLNETLDALRYNFFLKGSFKKMEKAKQEDNEVSP